MSQHSINAGGFAAYMGYGAGQQVANPAAARDGASRIQAASA
jgi:hypothetical protein